MVNNPTPRLRKLGHADMLVSNLPLLCFEREYCDTCQGSQGQTNNWNKKEVITNRVLELINLDLYGPSPIQRL